MIPRHKFAKHADKARFKNDILTLHRKYRNIVFSAPKHIRSQFDCALYDFIDAFHVDVEDENEDRMLEMAEWHSNRLNEALSTGQDELSVLISLADGNTTPTIIALKELQKQCFSMSPSEKKA